MSSISVNIVNMFCDRKKLFCLNSVLRACLIILNVIDQSKSDLSSQKTKHLKYIQESYADNISTSHNTEDNKTLKNSKYSLQNGAVTKIDQNFCFNRTLEGNNSIFYIFHFIRSMKNREPYKFH